LLARDEAQDAHFARHRRSNRSRHRALWLARDTYVPQALESYDLSPDSREVTVAFCGRTNETVIFQRALRFLMSPVPPPNRPRTSSFNSWRNLRFDHDAVSIASSDRISAMQWMYRARSPEVRYVILLTRREETARNVRA